MLWLCKRDFVSENHAGMPTESKVTQLFLMHVKFLAASSIVCSFNNECPRSFYSFWEYFDSSEMLWKLWRYALEKDILKYAWCLEQAQDIVTFGVGTCICKK